MMNEMAGSELLIQEADPPIQKFDVELEMADKMVPINKNKVLGCQMWFDVYTIYINDYLLHCKTKVKIMQIEATNVD